MDPLDFDLTYPTLVAEPLIAADTAPSEEKANHVSIARPQGAKSMHIYVYIYIYTHTHTEQKIIVMFVKSGKYNEISAILSIETRMGG